MQIVFDRLKDSFGDDGFQVLEAIQPTLLLPKEKFLEIARFLRDDENLRFETLVSQTASDWPEEEKLRATCHLYSYKLAGILVLHCDLPREEPVIDSLVEVWPGAEWLEREVWDLFGIRFEGHPDLRRIMLPEDWEGHPLRKDFEEKESYKGIPTQREREWLSWQK
ncbi:MAG: NADH-quinone oxidoreductase subunit C [Candidatus Krumholzibacteria bacterium]|jgi:NADH-quinone oxidoreductase subunit C|nr:NADH-quinone oxidoreductase subunit C [Candidatus Krumholzibacteria bacterium]MDP6668508.1 NADH-quinone oxidoreductase subunit C [Candidatus Krumholzibacteria bacterium]MDP6797028.1 NADH-quinone oxidoreductase subunit C [Candidatus Krumholzibacteria bacterium]MDP7021389.1 NADH-quinone oxidoreductase subunit C [Candidatus Krumholzibacteria bacterium]